MCSVQDITSRVRISGISKVSAWVSEWVDNEASRVWRCCLNSVLKSLWGNNVRENSQSVFMLFYSLPTICSGVYDIDMLTISRSSYLVHCKTLFSNSLLLFRWNYHRRKWAWCWTPSYMTVVSKKWVESVFPSPFLLCLSVRNICCGEWLILHFKWCFCQVKQSVMAMTGQGGKMYKVRVKFSYTFHTRALPLFVDSVLLWNIFTRRDCS